MATEDADGPPPAAGGAGTGDADRGRGAGDGSVGDGATGTGSATDRLPTDDPARDPDANYDYRNAEAVDERAFAADLADRIDGEVRFDEYSRQLYATDASAYEVLPVGVVFPRSTADVSAVVEYCAARGIPVLPRGGGTSLAGQTVNEAVVLDFTRYMDAVESIDPDERRATVRPGTVLGELNADLAEDDLKFAPDPAWGDKSAIGGAIGNNSTGSHSLVYGKTDAYIERCEVVLADGSVTELGPVTLEALRERAAPALAEGAETAGGAIESGARAAEAAPGGPGSHLEARLCATVLRLLAEERDAIDAAFPDMKRNVSGYNLDRLVAEAAGEAPASADAVSEPDAERVNLARLLAGSEGTLGIVTEATVALEPVPETKAVALLTYDELGDALADVPAILEHDPAAVEVMDDVLLDLARETEEFADVVGLLPDGTDSVLLVEFYAESDAAGRDLVAGLLADRCPSVDASGTVPEGAGADPSDRAAVVRTDVPVRAVDALEAHDAARRERFWKMRKSGLPILLSRTTDEKHIAFIEDTAVPPEHLAAYVERFEAILADHDTFASYYAHAGPGVLHIRPLIDTKSVDGVEAMADIADRVTDLVVEYGGSVSGEHGDGRARTVWNRKLYGDHVWGLFRELKTAVDPDWLLNPGQVCGEVSMTEDLRFDPEYTFDAGFDPALEWANENGFEGMVELCHGCGGCRGEQETTGGIMCPTYRAADEELLATRGRANMLRAAMSGELAPGDGTTADASGLDAVDEEFMREVLDLCVGCKGCSRDCPSEVDLAKLKAELTHQHHQRAGASLRDRLFANVGTLSRLGSATAPVSNWLQSLPGTDWLAERTLGIAAERELPTYERESLADWMADREPAVSSPGPAAPGPADAAGAERRALLVPDPYTNYSHPDVGRAAVRVLEYAGVHVELADVGETGRPAFSKGFLDVARERVEAAAETLAPRIEAGWDVVLVEPSDAVMFQSDARDLSTRPAVETLAANTYGVAEYLEAFDLPVPRAPGAGSDDDASSGGAPPSRLTYHGHCHQQSTGRAAHAPAALRRAGYDVEVLDSTCCGMAGSFGYEAEHYSLSAAIGEILFEQVEDADAGDGAVVAPGTSCRTQLDDGGHEARHPVEVLVEGL